MDMSVNHNKQHDGGDGWLLEHAKDNGGFTDGTIEGLCESFADWLDHDGATKRRLIVQKNGNWHIEWELWSQFSSWCRINIDGRWNTIIEGVGKESVRERVWAYFRESEQFRDRIFQRTQVVLVEGEILGWWYDVYDDEEEQEEEEEMGTRDYGKLTEIGVVSESGEIDRSKFRGLLLNFAREIEQLKGTEEEVNRDDIRNAFNRWMLDRVGNDWTILITDKFDPDDLMGFVVYMWANNDEFKGLITEKYEYDSTELEGNGSSSETENEDAEPDSEPDQQAQDESDRTDITSYDAVDEDQHTEERADPDKTETKVSEGTLSAFVSEGTTDSLRSNDTLTRGDQEEKDKEPITLDKSRLIQADCTDVVDRLEGRLGAVITDPPYGMGYDSRGDEHEVIKADDDLGQALKITEEVLKKSRMYLRDGSPVIVFAGKTNLPGVIKMVSKWYDLQDINVWYKKWVGSSQIGGNPIKWRPNHEYAVLATNGKPRLTNENRHGGNVWEFQRKGGDSMDHPTQKPLEMMRYIIKSITEPGDMVFDPFAGSGSTLVAAKQTDRNYIGTEMDPKHYQTAQDRLKQDGITDWV